jgi:F0F1-type ATP synthase assembly protein I
MADIVSRGLAVLAVVLFVVALFTMTIERFTAAGMSFLSASIVLYLRESRISDEQTP